MDGGVRPQWVSDVDLIGCHATAGIELRAAPNLGPLRDLAAAGPWDFSIVRFKQALHRPD